MNDKNTLSFASLILLLIFLFFAAGCADSEDSSSGNTGVYRFAIISDSHIKNDSAVDPDTKHATERFVEIGDELSNMAQDGYLDFVVHTGDHVNDLYCPKNDADITCFEYKSRSYIDYKCCTQLDDCYGRFKYFGKHRHRCPPPILGTYAKLVKDNFHVPAYYMVLGNHDDRYFSGGTKYLPDFTTVIRSSSKHQWLMVFGTEKSDDYVNKPAMYSYPSPFDNDIKTYYEVTYGGFQLLMLDCNLYQPDNCPDPHCNDEIHFAKDGHMEQWDWIAERLKDPHYHSAILFWHTRVAEFDVSKNIFLPMLAAYKNRIKAIFAGHGHHFAEDYWEEGMPDVPFYQTTSTVCRFDEKFDPPIPSYFHVELNETTKSVNILNYNAIFGTKERKKAAETACHAY